MTENFEQVRKPWKLDWPWFRAGFTEVPLVALVGLGFFTVLIAALLALAYFQDVRTKQVLEQDGSQKARQLVLSISDRIERQLALPSVLVQAVAAGAPEMLHANHKDLSGIEPILRSVFRSEYLKDFAALTSLVYADINNGDFIGIVTVNGVPSLWIQDARTGHVLTQYKTDLQSSGEVHRYPGYDPRKRAWYVIWSKTKEPSWTDVYENYYGGEFALSYLAGSVDAKNNVTGVSAIDLRPAFMDKLVEQVSTEGTGGAVAFVLDSKGRVLARNASDGVPAVHFLAGLPPMLGNNGAALDLAVRDFLALNHSKVADVVDGRLSVNGHEHRIVSQPLHEKSGLAWQVLVAQPLDREIPMIRETRERGLAIALLVGLVGTAFGILWLAIATRPIRKITGVATAIGYGRWDVDLPQRGVLSESNKLVNAFEGMQKDLRASFERLENLAGLDAISGALNRFGLEHKIWIEEKPSIFALIGLNQFRDLNEALGRDTGNEMLRQVADRLRNTFGPETIVARVGGDEFALVVADTADVDGVRTLIDKVFADVFRIGRDEIHQEACIGLVCAAVSSRSVRDVERDASIALGAAKKAVHVNFVLFSEDMRVAANYRSALVADLHFAIERGELQVHYQPIFDLTSRKCTGVEALVRWQKSDGSMVLPGKFIAVAEANGLIISLGQWVLNKSLEDMVNQIGRERLVAGFHLHVNVSTRQFMQTGFAELVKASLDRSGLPPTCLELELTESIYAGDLPVVAENLKRLREFGVSLALDDFGTGYSSLQYLHRFEFDTIKLDQSFVSRLSLNPVGEEPVIESILLLARTFHNAVVAEGVEDFATADLLQRMGCNAAQGYYFARPAPLEATLKILQDQDTASQNKP